MNEGSTDGTVSFKFVQRHEVEDLLPKLHTVDEDKRVPAAHDLSEVNEPEDMATGAALEPLLAGVHKTICVFSELLVR